MPLAVVVSHDDLFQLKYHNCPGLHQEKRGQQVEGGDSAAPLLCSRETPPGVLRPALEPPAQEGHGCAGAGPDKGHEDDQRAGVALIR